MKDLINTLDKVIDDKKSRLVEKAEMYFSAISIPSTIQPRTSAQTKTPPPISYIMYGIGATSAICGLCISGVVAKIVGLGVGAACTYGGYSIANGVKHKAVPQKPPVNVDIVKNEVTSKVIEAVKKIKTDWEEFMETQQRIISQSIQNSSFSEEKKDSMMSKIYVYEIIDIKISGFNHQMSSTSDLASVKGVVNTFKTEVIKAITVAADKQIAKYNSLLD